jgi:hypothetical protein
MAIATPARVTCDIRIKTGRQTVRGNEWYVVEWKGTPGEPCTLGTKGAPWHSPRAQDRVKAVENRRLHLIEHYMAASAHD